MIKWLRERWLLVALIIGGTLLIPLSEHIAGPSSPHLLKTIEGLGEAFLIAGILGLVVDTGLKVALARDALSFMVGWEVPESLREAVKDIVRFPAVRKDLAVSCTLEPCEKPKGFVKLTSHTVFGVRNLTGNRLEYAFRSGVEVARFPDVIAANLTNTTLRMEDGEAAGGPWQGSLPNAEQKLGREERTRSVTIPPKGIRWFQTERVQYYPDTFETIIDILPPACEGITVKVIDKTSAFDAHVRFGAAGDSNPNGSGGVWTLSGAHLPGQHIRIVWMKKGV